MGVVKIIEIFWIKYILFTYHILNDNKLWEFIKISNINYLIDKKYIYHRFHIFYFKIFTATSTTNLTTAKVSAKNLR